jgi:ribosomal protein S18 acetylase RimI-like enzyme
LSDIAARPLVRVARPGDATSIAHVHRDSWRTTYAGILPLDVIAREAGRKSEAMWRRRLALQPLGSATYLAERAAHGAVGFASCGDARVPIEGLDAEIYALYVLQAHQQRGIGRELVRACARHFVRHGLFGFSLWVLKANRARLFYEALGGEVIAERTERLGRHGFAEVCYGWHDLTHLVTETDS